MSQELWQAGDKMSKAWECWSFQRDWRIRSVQKNSTCGPSVHVSIKNEWFLSHWKCSSGLQVWWGSHHLSASISLWQTGGWRPALKATGLQEFNSPQGHSIMSCSHLWGQSRGLHQLRRAFFSPHGNKSACSSMPVVPQWWAWFHLAFKWVKLCWFIHALSL